MARILKSRDAALAQELESVISETIAAINNRSFEKAQGFLNEGSQEFGLRIYLLLRGRKR